MSNSKQTFKEFVQNNLNESADSIHKKMEVSRDRAGNVTEYSIEKGVTIVTANDAPGRYKEYYVYPGVYKDGEVPYDSQSKVILTHHLHDLAKGSNGLISPAQNERIKKEGRFQVGRDAFFKTAAAAKKAAADMAKKNHGQAVSTAKAAAAWGYTGKYSSVSRNR